MSPVGAHRHTGACRSAEDVLRAVPGLSYRRLDWWTARSYVRAAVTHPGYGVWRCWSDDEIEVMAKALGLVRLGFTARKAIEIARTPHAGHITELLSA